MPTPAKTLKRIRDLIAGADPASGAPRPEREIKALRAVELLIKHDVTIGETATPVAAAPPPPTPPPTIVQTPRSAWVSVRAPIDGQCGACLHRIHRGEEVWFRRGFATVHAWPCTMDVY